MISLCDCAAVTEANGRTNGRRLSTEYVCIAEYLSVCLMCTTLLLKLLCLGCYECNPYMSMIKHGTVFYVLFFFV